MIKEGERKFWEFQNNMTGEFHTLLFKLITKADNFNRVMLRRIYPEEVEAVRRYQNEKGYWENLDKEIRKGESNG